MFYEPCEGQEIPFHDAASMAFKAIARVWDVSYHVIPEDQGMFSFKPMLIVSVIWALHPTWSNILTLRYFSTYKCLDILLGKNFDLQMILIAIIEVI